MGPPLHITGVVNADWIIFIVGSVVGLYWLRALRLARQGARRFIWNSVKAFVVFYLLVAALNGMSLKTHLTHGQEQVIAGFVAVLCFGRLKRKKRPRAIPRATRRAVIERDLKGERFDPEKHQIDHVWPFSKGGSHTTDNLRVLDKKKNLQKGAKRPRMREMW